ncbi:ATP-binding protein [Pseudofrankia sp. EUN1h]|uniref:ATP-binding protein n=2 Tax=Pseudofrankia TaxID=2994363 RepID=UPI000684F0F6|nr:ATP-binding protein [Pseudofrankia sp. EUN1h]
MERPIRYWRWTKVRFVNRVKELSLLDEWFGRPGPQLGVVWGRRRVGKSHLLAHWAAGKRAIYHVSRNRALDQELAALSAAAAPVLELADRDLTSRPFRDWDEAFEIFRRTASESPLVLILDEFPELVQSDPSIESTLRAIWEGMGDHPVRLVLCGSAVRTMEALQEERAPLYGRATLRLQVRPFLPSEAALMLPDLSPAERAKAWGVCGGIPFYLDLWDQSGSFRDNLTRLVADEHGLLLNEGQLILATEDFAGGRRERIPEQVLRAIAAGRTRFGEIKGALGTDPTRALAALADLGLVQRVLPVGRSADPRRAYYRVADNFLAFWLAIAEPRRAGIIQGLGKSVAGVMEGQFDNFMGDRWEDAVRTHLIQTMADDPRLAPVIEVGRFWHQYGADPAEIDVAMLSEPGGRLSLAAEVKWARREEGGHVLRALVRKAHASNLLSPDFPEPLYAIAAREEVTGNLPDDVLRVTAADVFG